MKSKINTFLVTVLVLVVGCAHCADFPSTIERCKVEDEECMVKMWNKLVAVAYQKGIPELEIPISDKHYVDRQAITTGSNLLSIKITFTNLTIRGFANTTFTKIKGFKKDPKQISSIEIYGFSPYISVRGNYSASGKLLLLQVTGNGDGEIKYYNTKFKLTVSTKTEVKDGEEYLVPTNMVCEYKCERNHFRFDNVLNNKEISDSINKVINDNQELFGKEANQPSATTLSKIFRGILPTAFEKYPYRSFFLD